MRGMAAASAGSIFGKLSGRFDLPKKAAAV
jgi:hypothetical protein